MPITLKPEPPNFYEKIQKKGDEFLKEHPGAKGTKLKPLWREIIPELHEAYSGICAYTCHWIPLDTGFSTVDHYKSKDDYPQFAYTWDNYRLACGTINGRKGKSKDILDPFTLPKGWFELHFPSLQLRPNKDLNDTNIKSICTTIESLKLNGDTCVNSRRNWLVPYLQGRYGIDHLEEKAPFLASELKRQGLQDIHLPRWEAFRK